MKLLVLAFTFAFTSSVLADAPILSNKEAIDIIHSSWNHSSEYLPLGDVKVLMLSDVDNFEDKAFSPKTFSKYQIWEKLGVIDIIKIQGDLRRAFGPIPTFQIKAGSRGDNFDKTEDGWLKVPTGTYDITDIVRNEKFSGGGKELQLVMGFYQANWNSVYLDYLKAANRRHSTDRKFQSIFVYDYFESGWNLAAFDVTDRDKSFATSSVDRILSAYRSSASTR